MDTFKLPPLQITRLLTNRLILVPFTINMCKHFLSNDFSDLLKMGFRPGQSWPDNDVLETLPKIVGNLSLVELPTGFESWMIIKNDSLEVIGDIGFKGFNSDQNSIDLGYGIITEERKKGFAYEAATEIIRWAFSNEVPEEITASCLTDNLNSKDLLLKLDFIQLNEENEMLHWSLKRSRYEK